MPPPPEYHQWAYYRATRSFVVGSINYAVREGDHLWFNGSSIYSEDGRGLGWMCPELQGAVTKEWLVKIEHPYMATPYVTKEAFTSLDGFAILKKNGWDVLTVRCQACGKEALANELRAHQCVEVPRRTSWEHLFKDHE